MQVSGCVMISNPWVLKIFFLQITSKEFIMFLIIPILYRILQFKSLILFHLPNNLFKIHWDLEPTSYFPWICETYGTQANIGIASLFPRILQASFQVSLFLALVDSILLHLDKNCSHYEHNSPMAFEMESHSSYKRFKQNSL